MKVLVVARKEMVNSVRKWKERDRSIEKDMSRRNEREVLLEEES